MTMSVWWKMDWMFLLVALLRPTAIAAAAGGDGEALLAAIANGVQIGKHSAWFPLAKENPKREGVFGTVAADGELASASLMTTAAEGICNMPGKAKAKADLEATAYEQFGKFMERLAVDSHNSASGRMAGENAKKFFAGGAIGYIPLVATTPGNGAGVGGIWYQKSNLAEVKAKTGFTDATATTPEAFKHSFYVFDISSDGPEAAGKALKELAQAVVTAQTLTSGDESQLSNIDGSGLVPTGADQAGHCSAAQPQQIKLHASAASLKPILEKLIAPDSGDAKTPDVAALLEFTLYYCWYSNPKVVEESLAKVDVVPSTVPCDLEKGTCAGAEGVDPSGEK